jgi:predicted nucleotide-binding protein
MTNYEKLNGLISEAAELMQQPVSASNEKFQAWHMKVKRFLIKNFGDKSAEYQKFEHTLFSPFICTSSTPDEYFITTCLSGISQTKAILETYLEDFEDEQNVSNDNNAKVTKPNFSKIFIVHGHDGELKEAVARLVEQQNIEAIILSTKTNEGKTIIEKIEHYSDVGAAICLFTADDKGKSKLERTFNSRARQNVVFEAGYFMGKLGRNRLVIISENNVELPSDMSGMVYTSKNDWKVDVLKELKAMEFSIDFNKLYEG